MIRQAGNTRNFARTVTSSALSGLDPTTFFTHEEVWNERRPRGEEDFKSAFLSMLRERDQGLQDAENVRSRIDRCHRMSP